MRRDDGAVRRQERDGLARAQSGQVTDLQRAREPVRRVDPGRGREDDDTGHAPQHDLAERLPAVRAEQVEVVGDDDEPPATEHRCDRVRETRGSVLRAVVVGLRAGLRGAHPAGGRGRVGRRDGVDERAHESGRTLPGPLPDSDDDRCVGVAESQPGEDLVEERRLAATGLGPPDDPPVTVGDGGTGALALPCASQRRRSIPRAPGRIRARASPWTVLDPCGHAGTLLILSGIGQT